MYLNSRSSSRNYTLPISTTFSSLRTITLPIDLIPAAAEATIAILHERRIRCAMVGSFACKLYGVFRVPNDIDLLVLEPPAPTTAATSRRAEQLKAFIAEADPHHFFLKLPRDPTATYRILCYRQTSYGRWCKIDILLPGIMNLPYIPPIPSSSSTARRSSSRTHIKTISGTPLVPFSLLLLLKLQAWADHRVAPESFKRDKQHQDVVDIRNMFKLKDLMDELGNTRPWTDPDLFSGEFQRLTKSRVKEFSKYFPDTAVAWKSLGFETTTVTSSNIFQQSSYSTVFDLY